jgi:hypothetical protein
MTNKWIEHVKSVKKANPKLSLKQSLKLAKKTYKKEKGGEKMRSWSDEKKRNEQSEEEDYSEHDFKEDDDEQAPAPVVSKPQQLPPLPKKEVQKIVEREVNLSLLNDKLNYIIGLLQEI